MTAVTDVSNLDEVVRLEAAVRERFTADVMARNYLRLYWRLCGAAGRAHQSLKSR